MAYVLAHEIQRLAAVYGIAKLGFLTLTFADHVTDIRQAQKRFHSLNSNELAKRYRKLIGVWERQGSGRIHFHLVVVLQEDIRTGFDFAAVENHDYRSACPALRAEWAWLRRTAKAYRFGRTELLPVKSTAEGIARYVGKYVAKHIAAREERDKGARVVRFIGYQAGERSASARFSWATDNGWLWRHKLAAYARRIGARTTDDLSRMFGPRWAYLLQAEIIATDVCEAFPSEAAAERSFNMGAAVMMARQQVQANRESQRTGRVYRLRAFDDSASGMGGPAALKPGSDPGSLVGSMRKGSSDVRQPPPGCLCSSEKPLTNTKV